MSVSEQKVNVYTESEKSFSNYGQVDMMTIAPDVSDFDYSDYYPDQPIIDHAETSRTFNSSGLDTLVFVHIQKTGGSTLERRFVENIGKENGICQNILKFT